MQEVSCDPVSIVHDSSAVCISICGGVLEATMCYAMIKVRAVFHGPHDITMFETGHVLKGYQPNEPGQ